LTPEAVFRNPSFGMLSAVLLPERQVISVPVG